MFVEVDPVKVFLPYMIETYNLEFTNYISKIYLSVNGSSSKFAITYKFSKSALFRKFEAKIFSNPDMEVHIDESFNTVTFVFKSTIELQRSMNAFLQGNFSKIEKAVMYSYISRQDLSYMELKKDLIIQVVSRSKLLKKRIEKLLNVELTDSAELGNFPDAHDINLSY